MNELLNELNISKENMNNEDSNIIEKNRAEISLKEGECVIIITYELK